MRRKTPGLDPEHDTGPMGPMGWQINDWEWRAGQDETANQYVIEIAL